MTTASRPEHDNGDESTYLVHAGFCVGLYQVRATCVLDALRRWMTLHGVKGKGIAGRARRDPFYHLEVAFEVAGEERLVNVVAEEELCTGLSDPPI